MERETLRTCGESMLWMDVWLGLAFRKRGAAEVEVVVVVEVEGGKV